MLNLLKFEFIALNIFGNNYLSWILDAEQNNKLLMKNYQPYPTRSTAFPEANAMSFNGRRSGHYRRQRRGRKNFHNRSIYNNLLKRSSHHQKWNHKDNQRKRKNKKKKLSENTENICYKCGEKLHSVDIYQAPLKNETNFTNYSNNLEANFAKHYNLSDAAHLYFTDFFKTLRDN